ncbi:MAG: rhodanese-like domain-containing protein [Woeseiaceae bacterium]|nr:rhodanese-like domain-containing protein [Woeseiaceae bacterium]
MSNRAFLDLTPGEFVNKRESGELWQLLDVREPWEIEIASVKDCLAIPMAEVPRRIGELDLKAPIAVLCHSGFRSASIAVWLSENGADTVANISGGIDAWAMTVDKTLSRY